MFIIYLNVANNTAGIISQCSQIQETQELLRRKSLNEVLKCNNEVHWLGRNKQSTTKNNEDIISKSPLPKECR